MSVTLVIDLGTTYFKFALFAGGGQLVDWRGIAPPTRCTPDGWMELEVSGFTATIAKGISQLRARNPDCLAKVRAVTFATQTNSFLLLGRCNHPLTPIILWPDRRAAALEPDFQCRCALPGFSHITGIPLPNCQFMAAKLLWHQQHRPAVWNRTARLCLISDYLTLLLTGRHVTEAGAAGLTGLVDLRSCCWWPEILDRLEIPAKWLPWIVRAGTDLGPVHAQSAAQFGLPSDCRVVVGCLDQYAGAIGVGNVLPDMISETTGTVLASVRCADRLLSDGHPKVFQGPAFRQGLYYRMIVGKVSARYLEWYREQLPDRPGFAELAELAANVEPGAAGLVLRTDMELTSVEEVFDGVSSHHTRGHFVRCIMEAVAGMLQQQVATISDGVPPTEVRSAGGAARSDAWLQIKADALGAAVVATHCPEPTSLGAAMLAEMALGETDMSQLARRWVRLKPPRRPSPQRVRHSVRCS